MSQLAPGSQSITEERVEERYEEGDEERFSHYVPKAKLTEAQVMGTPVVALCGKVWIPSRDASKYPVCPRCKALRDGMGKNGRNWPFSDGSNGSDK